MLKVWFWKRRSQVTGWGGEARYIRHTKVTGHRLRRRSTLHTPYEGHWVEEEIRLSAVINQISSTPVTLRQICSYTSERLMHFMFISTHFSRWRHSTARPPVRPRACPPPPTPSAQQTDRRRILSAHSFLTKSFPLNTGPSDFVPNCQLFKIYS